MKPLLTSGFLATESLSAQASDLRLQVPQYSRSVARPGSQN